MKIKDGVYTQVTVVKSGVETVLKPSAQIQAAWKICDDVSKQISGVEIVITSVLDGKHKNGSKHYVGNGTDIRSTHYKKDEIPVLLKAFKDALGNDYDVIFEVNHFHIEYDPK